ncbi:hypothetical protein [Pacificoceanicola onchidii]|uniref:hypothetical protein n=1 Tax=Pacificoceanicola onchidii TaxID=2562685 RepID=UPI0010A317ED|nr:hypothetical protein [Pacificoceanicola onchidii]
MIRAVLCFALCFAGSTTIAQTIPLPFSDSVEARQVSVVVTPDRRSMKGLPTHLVRARRAMHAKQDVSDADLRALAEKGDGLAAQRYVRRLVAQGKARSEASDVAYFSAVAVGAGRVWTLPDMIEAMHHLSAETEPRKRISTYIKVLYAHAWAGNTLALDAVVAFNGDDKLFGALSERTRDKILAQGKQNADGKVELRMAVEMLEQGSLSEQERARTRDLLAKAAASGHLGIMTTAENLMAQMDREAAADG